MVELSPSRLEVILSIIKDRGLAVTELNIRNINDELKEREANGIQSNNK